LDPVEPECFHALFPRAVEALQAGGGLTSNSHFENLSWRL